MLIDQGAERLAMLKWRPGHPERLLILQLLGELLGAVHELEAQSFEPLRQKIMGTLDEVDAVAVDRYRRAVEQHLHTHRATDRA